MKLAFNIARRYLFGKKSTSAINLISMISATAMFCGAFALVVVLSVFNGFEGIVKSLYDSFNPDFKVSLTKGKIFETDQEVLERIRAIDGVDAVSLVLEELAVLRYGDKTTPCRMKAVDQEFRNVSGVDTTILRGQYILKDRDIPYSVVGRGIEKALRIDVFSDFDKLDIFMPRRSAKKKMNPEEAFNIRAIKPIGTFTIQEEFDKDYIFVPLSFGQEILDYQPNQVSSIEIAIADPDNSDAVQSQLKEILGHDFDVKNRYEQEEFLYKVMKTEKWAVYFILSLILIVASFNIIGSLSMLVLEKSKDIAILKAMGGTKEFIRNIFLLEGVLLSITGSLLGMLAAFLFCAAQQKYGFIELHGDSLLLKAYPVEMQWPDFLLVFLTIIIITFVASYFPARKASEVDETLRTAD